ncbi:cytochrome P450 [Cadophora sp. DSE1049]|nr:cytochrome P450 [Cadophora sp. DSE1049]
MALSGLETVVAVLVAIILWKIPSSILFPKKTPHPLPPGPKGEPILGHLRVVPSDKPENAYAKWSKEYNSDVLYFNILGQPVVVLNSVQAAVDLLDKRGSNYCDRPRFVLFEVMGWGMTLTFLRWGPRFQMHRKLIQGSFTKPNCVQYQELQESETHVLVDGIMKNPNDWERQMRRFATAIVLGIGFGVSINDDNDPYIQMAVDASYALGHGGAPAGTVVDFFPFIKYLPNWLARSQSLKFARDWKWAIQQIHNAPFAAVEKEINEGTAQPSFIHTLLERNSQKSANGEPIIFNNDDIKGAAGAIYAAGQDTTWSTLVVFILNMVLHPEIQKKAQAEIDAVVGHDRLPDFNDRPSLPYIDRIVQETLRWGPVSPVGVPHKSLEDDVYNGMFIPKGSFVYANALAMTHDETTYADPETFNPDRFKPQSEGGAGEPFPIGQFGFGRRICPGRHLAEASVWIVMVTMLATMNITKAVDTNGKELIPDVELTPGLTSHPTHFPCVFRPRSRLAEELVEDSL